MRDGVGRSDVSQTRLSVNINSHTVESLSGHAETFEVSITEALRRLVGVGDYIAQAQAAGCDVLLRSADGKTERVVFTY